MAELNAAPFTFADLEHYDSISRIPLAPDYLEMLKERLPPTWTINRFDIWLGARGPDTPHPSQGFKIHVSTLPQDAMEVIGIICDTCVATNTQFKINADPRFHRYMISKRCGRGNAGKFATLYPRHDAACLSLMQRLHEQIGTKAGPHILSDRPFGMSRAVFYRYGGFTSIKQLNADGGRSSMILSATGAPTIDERLPYFRLPPGVADPFEAFAPAPSVEEGEDAPLNGRFDVTGALTYSNAGGVYRGVDRSTGVSVVIKEARANINVASFHAAAVTAVEALKAEYSMLSRLSSVQGVVKPIDLFREWEHHFLVEEFVDGVPLSTFRAFETVILLRRMHDHAARREFEVMLSKIGCQLLDIIDGAHGAGVILGDLSTNNILIHRDTYALTLIDVESAFLCDDDSSYANFASKLYTPGFRRDLRQQRPLSFHDDYYAAGVILHSLVLPVEAFFDLEPSAINRFLKRFVDAGLSEKVKFAVDALLTGDGATGRRFLIELGTSV